MGKKDTPLCKTYKEIDTIEHRFYLCDSTKTFFGDFLNWLNSLNLCFILELSCQNVIFGIGAQNTIDFLINYSLLLSKYYIQGPMNAQESYICTLNSMIFRKIPRKKLYI